jgi:hypothetical protein
MSCIECAVTVKYSDSKVVNRYLHYDAFTLDPMDKKIQSMVRETLEKIKPEDGEERPAIVLKTTMIIQ